MESEEVTFSHANLPRNSFLAFEEMRKNKELCDLTIKIQDHTVVAHRVVLAAGIPYFRLVLVKGTGGMDEKEIDISDVNPSALESLIQYAYSSEVKISLKNVYSLLLASEFLQVCEVKDACVKFLSQRLRIHNFAEVRTLAHTINNQKLSEQCNTYIQQNFEEFSKSKTFLGLPLQCIEDSISGSELNVSGEEIVFEAVINWVKFSPEERQNLLPDLLRKVRMTTLPINYLIKRVASEELIKASPDCKDLIQNVQSFHLLPEDERGFLNLNTSPRRKINKQIYAFCGSNSHEHSVHLCDFSKGTWNKVNSDKSHKGYVLCTAPVNDNLYVFLENEIKTFCLKSRNWEILKSSNKHIMGSAVFVQGSLIHFFGSSDSLFYDKVRCFDTHQKKWLKETRMQTGRYNAAVTSLNVSVYVTGGFWEITLKTFEKYDLSTAEWKELSPMLVSRSLHGSATVNEKIYVFGGGTRSDSYLTHSSSSEVYDPLTGLWSTVASMKTARNRFSCVSHCGKIYAFGGRTVAESSSSRNVEFYDPECDEWKSSFNVPEGFVGAVVI